MALTAKKVYAILKRQISDMEAKIKTPIIYRGTVATADLLPENPKIGDMYNIESKSIYGEAGMNVAWNGVVWDTMGAPIDMSLYIKSSELADWVKQQNKPTYTANEVGALPADTKIPSKTSELKNDSGFLTKVPDSYLNGTDTTLKESGKAADAKATGDKFTEMSADISKKLDKNQGSENSGKIAGINESGDIVPMFPVGVEYNEETNCLEFGSDQKMKLNQGIGLDSTLTKTGFAADAGATGKEISSLKEDLGDLAHKNGVYYTTFYQQYHELNNGKVVIGGDKAVTSLRSSTNAITINEKFTISSSGLTLFRVWFLLADTTSIGYTDFISEYKENGKCIYNGQHYDCIYIDTINSDGTSSTPTTAKNNIKITITTDIDKNMWCLSNGGIVGCNKNKDGTYTINNAICYRDGSTSQLFEKFTFHFKIRSLGVFGFGTKNEVDPNGIFIKINPTDKTLKIYNSESNGGNGIKRNLSIDFNIVTNEEYGAEIIKNSVYETTIRFYCLTDSTKYYEYIHNQQYNKISLHGCPMVYAENAVITLYEMSQKVLCDKDCELLIFGDSFVESGNVYIDSSKSFAYMCKELIGNKLCASGHGGAYGQTLLQNSSIDLNVAKFRYVYLAYGSNDSLGSIDNYKRDLLKMIEKVEKVGAIPILSTIPIRNDNGNDNTNFVNTANSWVKSLGYKYIDLYAIVNNRTVDDGVHPNEVANKMILDSLKVVAPLAFN